MKKYYQMATPRHLQTDLAALAQKKHRYHTCLRSTIYKTYEMPNLLAFAKYVLHHVAVETLLMVITIVMVIVLTIIVVIVMVIVIVIVIVITIVIVLLHGCGETAIIRYISGDYKKETMSHRQQT
jgi:fatty acid desaturase